MHVSNLMPYTYCFSLFPRPELDKPASTRISRLLASILDKCIRSTNSQYDDSDVLKRLDVRISEPSQGDSGWDVFSLDYKVDGPLATVTGNQIFFSS